MAITHISLHFPNIFLLCESGMNDIFYRQRDAMRKPELQWLRPFRPVWTCSWAMLLMYGRTDKLSSSLEHPLTTKMVASEGCICPAAILTVISLKGCVGIYVLQRLSSCQDGNNLASFFSMLLAMQETSPCDLGQSTENNEGVSQTQVFLRFCIYPGLSRNTASCAACVCFLLRIKGLC